jgi:hypothetical protein
MATKPLYEDCASHVINRYNEAIVVAFNVKDHPFRAKQTCIRVALQNICGILPVRSSDFIKPRVQSRLDGLLILVPLQGFDKPP